MAKAKTVYSCSECGAVSPKWQGQCPGCGQWNTLVESIQDNTPSRFKGLANASVVQSLAQVEAEEAPRTGTGIDELDRVLGGGIVRGAVVLIGGDPGIGKSTLLLQALANLGQQHKVLYVSGEESAQQIALRGTRLAIDPRPIRLLAEISVEKILATLQQEQPDVAVIDSIQTVYTEQLQSAPGSVAQVRECAAQLTRYAKSHGTSLILVGHVTKEGALAGPRVLEHIVDTVLYFEGDTHSSFRLIRAIKNRFGAVNELGVFAMVEHGLREVKNPSAIFLSGRREPAAGTLVTALWEGTRPLLVELQALVDQNHHGQPRRLAVGTDLNRLALLLAILHRHGGLFLGDQDVFVNVVGGVKVDETSADLALVLALVSSFRNRPLPQDLLVFGEVGLAGEIRPVPSGIERLQEAAKHGFTRAIVPSANAPRQPIAGMTVTAVERVADALESF